jgi:hypothetical protein
MCVVQQQYTAASQSQHRPGLNCPSDQATSGLSGTTLGGGSRLAGCFKTAGWLFDYMLGMYPCALPKCRCWHHSAACTGCLLASISPDTHDLLQVNDSGEPALLRCGVPCPDHLMKHYFACRISRMQCAGCGWVQQAIRIHV